MKTGAGRPAARQSTKYVQRGQEGFSVLPTYLL